MKKDALFFRCKAEAEKAQINMDEEIYCYLCPLGDELNIPYDETSLFRAASPREAFEMRASKASAGTSRLHVRNMPYGV